MQHKLAQLEVVSLKFDEAKAGYFAGYASKFGLVDSYGDTVAPGAYKATLKGRERPIVMRWNHYGPIVGKWLSMAEDEKGLFVEGELTPGHSVAQDVYASLKHGSIDGLSIGYRVKQQESTGEDTRILKEIELIEISVVEQPADLGARIGDVKSALAEMKSLKEIEALLRDAGGFSRADACAMVTRIKSLGQSDSVSKQGNDFGALLALHAATASLLR